MLVNKVNSRQDGNTSTKTLVLRFKQVPRHTATKTINACTEMGPRKSSKRQRKQKDKHSLKRKGLATPANVADALQVALGDAAAACG